MWLSHTFNNLQVTDGCVSPSKHVQVIRIMGCIVGCGNSCSDALRVNTRIELTDFHDLLAPMIRTGLADFPHPALAAASILTEWSEPVPGRELHPLKSSASFTAHCYAN